MTRHLDHQQNSTHLSVGFQVIVEDIDGNGKVSSVEGILSVPTLRPKLPPLSHTGVKVTQGEEDGLELLLPAALVQDFLQTVQ